jgi:hypothetical protein
MFLVVAGLGHSPIEYVKVAVGLHKQNSMTYFLVL